MMPFSVNVSPSFVKAAFTTSGVMDTVGQAALSAVFTNSVLSFWMMGKKMMSGFCLASKTRLWMWAMATLLGKHWSMEPLREPLYHIRGSV